MSSSGAPTHVGEKSVFQVTAGERLCTSGVQTTVASSGGCGHWTRSGGERSRNKEEGATRTLRGICAKIWITDVAQASGAPTFKQGNETFQIDRQVRDFEHMFPDPRCIWGWAPTRVFTWGTKPCGPLVNQNIELLPLGHQTFDPNNARVQELHRRVR